MNLNRFITLLTLPLALGAAAQTDDITFSYATDNVPKMVGTTKIETYDVAISLVDPSLTGLQITQISVPVLPRRTASKVVNGENTIVECFTDLSIWLSKELKVELVDGKNVTVPDIARWSLEIPETADEGVDYAMVTYTLAEPYTVTAEGLYVGYSLTVDAMDGTDATKYPLVGATPGRDGGLLMRTSRQYRTWSDRSAQFDAVSRLSVQLRGESQSAGAGVAAVGRYYCLMNNEGPINVTVSNLGNEAITSLDYTVTIGESSLTATIDLSDDPVPAIFGGQKDITLTAPAVAKSGTYTSTVTINGVNGDNNPADNNSLTGTAHIMSFMPVNRPLLEEFTGTGCGWCPRGYVALEYMDKEYPNDFIAVAWHGYKHDDPMYPQQPLNPDDPSQGLAYPAELFVTGAPGAVINRTLHTDPYYGGSNTFGLENLWLLECEPLATVAIDVEAEWNEPEALDIKGTVTWAALPVDPNQQYRVEFILVGDGLHGDGIEWMQANGYGVAYKDLPLMDQFAGKSSLIMGLDFNDVGLYTTRGCGALPVLPEAVIDSPVEVKTTINPSLAINAQRKTIAFIPSKLRVVALVLADDGQYGRVVNCNRCEVKGTQTTGINTLVADDAQVVNETLYDMTGRRISSQGASGIVIRVATMSDGSTRSYKEVVR